MIIDRLKELLLRWYIVNCVIITKKEFHSSQTSFSRKTYDANTD